MKDRKSFEIQCKCRMEANFVIVVVITDTQSFSYHDAGLRNRGAVITAWLIKSVCTRQHAIVCKHNMAL